MENATFDDNNATKKDRKFIYFGVYKGQGWVMISGEYVRNHFEVLYASCSSLTLVS